MHARVATFDYTGIDAEDVRRAFEEINERAAAGFREDLPAVGLLDLYNPDDGKVLSITLFDTEEDLRKGDATLSSWTRLDPAPRASAFPSRCTRYPSRSTLESPPGPGGRRRALAHP
jgi:hypothetical protein